MGVHWAVRITLPILPVGISIIFVSPSYQPSKVYPSAEIAESAMASLSMVYVSGFLFSAPLVFSYVI